MFHRRNPDARLVAVGCYAGRSPRELEVIEGVDLVLDNADKWNLIPLLGASGRPGQLAAVDSIQLYDNTRRTRAFIKVQDGCRNSCAYCIVPLVRNREESVSAAQVVNQVRERVSAGHKEVVLTGTEIGTYNHDGVDLRGLLERILAETAVARLRLSSVQPPEITSGLIGLWRDPRLCPHFHLSLQSGSDAVLGRMRRRYDTAGYRRAVSLIRESVLGVAVTTDVIVGFPGETDAEFQESLDFCRQMQFARIHVFPYSPRPGTEAANMLQTVPAGVKKQRRQQMLALAGESVRDFIKMFLGGTAEVLWEKRPGGIWSGLTGNYIKVYTRNKGELTNKLLPVKLEKIYRDGVWGMVL
jgi:threonylcarbamoyladenosine tRNA methylthiotransferase MtaB